MKKKRLKIISIVILTIAVVFCVAACNSKDGVNPVQSAKSSYSTSYKTLSEKSNGTGKWREGMVSGNGLQGFIASGSPYNDTLIYQNIHFILPNKNARENPISFQDLDYVRQSIVNGQDIVDNQSYDDVYSYHAGATLRIKQSKPLLGHKEYKRYTDYETACVGVQYTDSKGKWERLSFTSQCDGVSISKMTASDEGNKINTTISMDNISSMANFGKSNEVDLRYKKLVDADANALTFVAHYPDYENSELKDGGYATVSFVICEGGKKERITNKMPKETQYVGEDNPAISITDADSVYIISVSDRTFNMGEYGDFADSEDYELVNELYSKVRSVADKYTVDGKFDFDKALKNHTDIFTPQFNALSLDLGADINISNNKLLRSVKLKKSLSNTLAERAYYAGRYAYLCCSGVTTSRLYGMWTGEWKAAWGSKYTMDANVNLQTSSMNTGNIISAPIGYVNFILRQVPDWEDNAYATHGMKDALQAPVNCDGDRAIFTESCYPYPFRYWNAGTSWMLQPLYETILCYGNLKVPICDEFDLDKLKTLLSTTQTPLSDNEIVRLKERGYLMLKEDILYPLLIKSANYWYQLMTPQYYTDADGYIRYEKGKTSLSDGETYCIIPSYSPENNPSNYPSPACANSAIDISACNSNIQMLLDIASEVAPNDDMSKWITLQNNLPKLIYDKDGSLKEWASYSFEENNKHRHLSHLYCAWPLSDTRYDSDLNTAAILAINNRKSENNASHALIHRTLIAARLNDRQSATKAMVGLMNSKIYYNSLMTNHHTNKRSGYCTDYSIGYLGMVNECLVFSNKGEIELLPCLPTSGFDKGSVKGMRLRTQAVLTNMEWDVKNKTLSATIVSDIDQTVKISCGLSDEIKTVELKKGEEYNITMTI
ncbi:MAG: glycoside hydrolase N-terminal domain-containing protein [Clostridia bacterium]|nr:glycoside hydrolase N-terminal domain-containing protein [Clostridia bacterium]